MTCKSITERLAGPRQPTIALLVLVAVPALLAACASTEPPSPAAMTRQNVNRTGQSQLRFQLASGTYHCELGHKVDVQREANDPDRLQLSWQGNHHTLRRVDSKSGLPRFEDRKNGLLWIDLPWKSVLLDANSGRPLANECKAHKQRAALGLGHKPG